MLTRRAGRGAAQGPPRGPSEVVLRPWPPSDVPRVSRAPLDPTLGWAPTFWHPPTGGSEPALRPARPRGSGVDLGTWGRAAPQLRTARLFGEGVAAPSPPRLMLSSSPASSYWPVLVRAGPASGAERRGFESGPAAYCFR